MYIHQVPHDTEFTFKLEDDTIYTGVFKENIDHMAYVIYCPDISKNIDDFREKEIYTKFFSGENFYEFKSKVLGVSAKKDGVHETIDFRVATPFKEVQIRSNFRIKLSIKVRIHDYVDDYKKMYSLGWLCDAVSDDISKDGIRLWCDHQLEERKGEMFTLEFSLKTNWIYMIPIKLVRCDINRVTRSYNYDYGFIFDFSAMPDRQEKLILDILKHKIMNRS